LPLGEKFLRLEIDGEKVIRSVYFKEELYNGPYLDQAPDIVLLSHYGYDLKAGVTKKSRYGTTHFTGMHSQDNAMLIDSFGFALDEHPNIVEIFYVGTWHNLPYIEMERIDGWTLDEMVTRFGALPVEVATAIAVCVARALNYAHNQKYMIFGKEYRGIIHRDLKPANIMIGREGAVKLMDFGIAKPVKASHRTTEGMVVGTMAYLSPEQLQGKEIDMRADIYSFGSVLYELLTGRKTFPEENLARLITDKLSNNFLKLNISALKCPLRLKKLLQRCLTFDKQKRVQDSGALLHRLEIIHKSISPFSPEEVLQQFVTADNYEKRVVAIRRKPVLITLIVAFALSLLFAAGSLVGIRYFMNRKLSRAASETTTSPPPAAPRPSAAAPTSPAPKPPETVDTKETDTRKRAAREVPSSAPPVPRKVSPLSESTPVTAQKTAPPRPLSVRERLEKTHGTPLNNAVVTLSRAGKHREALRVFSNLAKNEKTDKTVIHAVKSATSLNDTGTLNKLLF